MLSGQNGILLQVKKSNMSHLIPLLKVVVKLIATQEHLKNLFKNVQLYKACSFEKIILN